MLNASTTATLFHSSPLLQRDLLRFNASCMGEPAARLAVGNVQRTDRFERLLVVEGACLCHNGGLGNLFGDFAMWFLVAALTRRSLFVDWTGSSRDAGPSLQDGRSARRRRRGFNPHEVCQAPSALIICDHVRQRFDLGRYFGIWRDGLPGATARWQWSRHTRRLATARHGAHAELWLRASRAGHSRITCDRLAAALRGADAWVTVGVDDWAGGVFPQCARETTASAATTPTATTATSSSSTATAASSATTMEVSPAGWSHLLGSVLGGFVQQLRTAELRDDATYFDAAAERLQSTFDEKVWGVSLRMSVPRLQKRRQHGRMSVRALQREQSDRIGQLMACAMHAHLRPLPELQRRLLPVLLALQSAAVVTLQLRTGWGEQADVFGAQLGVRAANVRERLARSWLAPPRDAPVPTTTLTTSEHESCAHHHVKGQPPPLCHAKSREERVRTNERIAHAPAFAPVAAQLRHGQPAHTLLFGDDDHVERIAHDGQQQQQRMEDSQHHQSIRDKQQQRIALVDARWQVLSAASKCGLATALTRRQSTAHQKQRATPALPLHDTDATPRCFAPSPDWTELSVRGGEATRKKEAWQLAAAPAITIAGAARSHLAKAVQCAARVAQSLAAERAVPPAAGAPLKPSSGWQLYLATDSPGLRAVIERLPALRDHTLLNTLHQESFTRTAVESPVVEVEVPRGSAHTEAAAEGGRRLAAANGGRRLDVPSYRAGTAADSGRRLDDRSYVHVAHLTDVHLAADMWMLTAHTVHGCTHSHCMANALFSLMALPLCVCDMC
jgi:hypothetical protein